METTTSHSLSGVKDGHGGYDFGGVIMAKNDLIIALMAFTSQNLSSYSKAIHKWILGSKSDLIWMLKHMKGRICPILTDMKR
ncbi:hypothetical protein Tco_0432421 [Tanacetum coccineum]